MGAQAAGQLRGSPIERIAASLMTKPKPDHLKTIIKINRSIVTGLRGKA